MNVCLTDISDSLAGAIEISRHFINTPNLNPVQEKILYIAHDFIRLCKKFFTININRSELDIIQKWNVKKGEEISELFLAKKENNYYLYSTFVDCGVKALGFYISDNEIPFIQNMNSKEILNYFNNVAFSK